MPDINITEHTLDILRNNTESQGKMKGNIELLSEKISTLTRVVDKHDDEFKNTSEKVKATINTIEDGVSALLVKFDANPNSKIIEQQVSSDRHFSTLFNAAMKSIDELARFEEKMHEILSSTMASLSESVKENTESTLKKNERKWKFWTGLTVLLFSLLGNVLVMLKEILK